MPKKLFLQPSPTRLKPRSQSRRSKSLDERSSSRKSPIRGRISFQIREKKEQQHAVEESPKQQFVEQTAFDPFSTSFISMTKDDHESSHSPTTVMEMPSFEPSFDEMDMDKSKSKSLSPNFQRKSMDSKTSPPTFSPAHMSNDSMERKPSNRIIPGVSEMTMRQTLAVIYGAFWERADLYTDVLALAHDKPSARQLRLAFFRQGRIVLATPIESPDDMTTIDAGTKPIFAVGGGSVSNNPRNIVQSGVTVSRKAKMKFQAINLAYDLLNDPDKRKAYNEWRLWHCRLPDPEEVSQRKLEEPVEEKLNPYQKLTNQELHFVMKEGKNLTQTQYSFDSGISVGTGTDDSSVMGISINSKSSLPSILKEPTFGKKKKKKKIRLRSQNKNESNSSNNDRRIRWNEEVEELVILECSRDQSEDSIRKCDLPSRDSSQNTLQKENINPFESEFLDPYQNQTIEDDWFGQQAKYSRNRQGQDQNSYNFQSLQDSRLASVEAKEPPQAGITKGALDDSLIEILDAPNHLPPLEESKQSSPWADKVGTEMQEIQSARHSPIRVSEQIRTEMKEWQLPRNSPNRGKEKEKAVPGHHVISEDTFHVGKGGKNNVKINVRSYQKENNVTKVSQTLQSSSVQKSTNAADNSPKDLFERYKEAQYELDVDEFSIDTKSTKDTFDSFNWRSHGQSLEGSFAHQNDCAIWGHSNNCSPLGQTNDCTGFRQSDDCSKTFYRTNDCTGGANDCGTIDLAKGFQATLSNYINAAVSDMKEGFMSLGKKWEENVPKMSENGENPFMLNSFELDAMMDILKVEMSTISPQMKGRDCTG